MAEFSGKRFTDTRLLSLKNLDRIEFLHLYDTAVTDAGIQALRVAMCLKEVHITSEYISDASMRVLSALPSIKSLLIAHGPRITDKGVRYVKSAPRLRELYLDGTQVTDRGIRSLAGLNELWSLSLNDTAIGDKGMRSLHMLPALSLLSINRTRVTGVGLCALPNNEYLHLYMDKTPASDKGLRAFARCLTNLKVLDLSRTNVSDKSAPVLASLLKLNELRLTDTQITDAMLQAFHSHPHLDALEVSGTRVTKDGVKALKKARRKMAVYMEPVA
jgi:internalin A